MLFNLFRYRPVQIIIGDVDLRDVWKLGHCGNSNIFGDTGGTKYKR